MSSFEKTTAPQDGLIAGTLPQLGQKVTLLSGEVRTRGALLGKITKGGASSAAKSGGNTGNGTFVLDATTPVRPGAKVGVYTLRCINAATNGGTFRLEDPDGMVLGDFTITGGAGGTVTVDDDIKGVLTDGGTDFVAGDGFDVTVAAGSGKYKLSAAASVDGSEVPDAVLAEDADGTSGDVDALVYTRGDFNQNAMTFGAGHTAASVREGLRDKGIHLIDAQEA